MSKQPQEAITVRRIYAEFLDGGSLKGIAEGLMKDGIPSPSGSSKWHATTVESILKNEKYKGDCHLQKTYLPDFLSPHRIKNEGQAESYYVEDSHAAIISKAMFDMVQQEFEDRRKLRSGGKTGHGKFSGKYPFSGMIICRRKFSLFRRTLLFIQFLSKTLFIQNLKSEERENSNPATVSKGLSKDYKNGEKL